MAFALRGQSKRDCAFISGGEISIKDGTFDRLKVTGDGKLTLNGGKYYAIDVTGSTYANYGQSFLAVMPLRLRRAGKQRATLRRRDLHRIRPKR